MAVGAKVPSEMQVDGGMKVVESLAKQGIKEPKIAKKRGRPKTREVICQPFGIDLRDAPKTHECKKHGPVPVFHVEGRREDGAAEDWCLICLLNAWRAMCEKVEPLALK